MALPDAGALEHLHQPLEVVEPFDEAAVRDIRSAASRWPMTWGGTAVATDRSLTGASKRIGISLVLEIR